MKKGGSINKLEKELYDYANREVGKIGKGTLCNKAITGEMYITIKFNSLGNRLTRAEKKYIFDTWCCWIEYYKYKKNNPVIYWRVLPEIYKQNKYWFINNNGDLENKNIDGTYVIRARLLISNKKTLKKGGVYGNRTTWKQDIS